MFTTEGMLVVPNAKMRVCPRRICALTHTVDPRADSSYSTTLLWRDVPTNIVRRKDH